MLVCEDRHDRVELAYNDPLFLASKHEVTDQDPGLGDISNAFAAIAQAAGGEN